MPLTQTDVTGVILAGGQGRRMGGVDKGLLLWQSQPLVSHLIQALRPQVKTILINANRHQATYAHYGYPVISDTLTGFQGPLAGLLTALKHAETSYVLTLPCDSPFLTEHFAARLVTCLNDSNAALVVAHDGQQLQPTYALVPTYLYSTLYDFISQGERKLRVWFEQQQAIEADCSDIASMFQNINTPEHYQALQKGYV